MSKITTEYTNLNWDFFRVNLPKEHNQGKFIDIDKLTKDNRIESLNNYTSIGYLDMNESLRGNIISTDKTKKYINDLNSLIDDFGIIYKNITLFKFTDYEEYKTAKIGHTIIDKGFFSQTKDYKFASNSAKNTGYLINIHWPTIKAIYTNNSEESEVLTNSGIKLIIDDVEQQDDYIEISATGSSLFTKN